MLVKHASKNPRLWLLVPPLAATHPRYTCCASVMVKGTLWLHQWPYLAYKEQQPQLPDRLLGCMAVSRSQNVGGHLCNTLAPIAQEPEWVFC